MQKIILVIPCFNEERRLQKDEFLSLIQKPDLHLLFVNDGSTDNTEQCLLAIQDQAKEKIELLSLERNQGKAEAVRRGLIYAIEKKADIVGYIDADFAVPVREVLRLIKEIKQRQVAVVIASRVKLLGRRIDRNVIRHYLGRAFATFSSFALRLPIYDTQCGGKLFRNTEILLSAVESPFFSRWAFDVELIGRLLIGTESVAPLSEKDFLEVPLEEWRDVPGSKMHFFSMAKMGMELLLINFLLLKRRRAQTVSHDHDRTHQSL